MTPSIAALQSGDLSAFPGAQITGILPIRESFLNEQLQQAIRARRGRVQQVEIRIGANNVIECGVRVSVGPFSKWFRPQMILAPQFLTEHGPRMVLTIASNEYAGLLWIAQVFAAEFFPRGFTINGRQIIIDLAAIPQLAEVRNFLRYLHVFSARTTPGLIRIDFALKVDNQ